MVSLKHQNKVGFIWVFWDSQLVKSINLSKQTGTVLLAHEIQVRFYFFISHSWRSFNYEYVFISFLKLTCFRAIHL